MNGDSTDAVLKALKVAFLAHAPITALVGVGSAARVFDWPGAGAAFPCICLGDVTFTPFDASDMAGADLLVTVHVFAKGTDARAKARQLGNIIGALLHDTPGAISPTGHRVIILQQTMAQVLRDEASEAQAQSSTAHGIYRFRVVTVAAS